MQELFHFLAPLRGAIDALLRSGGLRFAPTSGYFLTTLRVVILRSRAASLLAEESGLEGDLLCRLRSKKIDAGGSLGYINPGNDL